MFRLTHPVVGTRDVGRSIDFYTPRLGFTLIFSDAVSEPNDVAFQRDAVELHTQFQFEHEMSVIRLRFVVDDPDELYKE